MDQPDPVDLKILRIRAGLRQFQVAQALGIPASRLADLENGRRPLTTEWRDLIVQAIDRAAPHDSVARRSSQQHLS